jgi:hypothetical protein
VRTRASGSRAPLVATLRRRPGAHLCSGRRPTPAPSAGYHAQARRAAGTQAREASARSRNGSAAHQPSQRLGAQDGRVRRRVRCPHRAEGPLRGQMPMRRRVSSVGSSGPKMLTCRSVRRSRDPRPHHQPRRRLRESPLPTRPGSRTRTPRQRAPIDAAARRHRKRPINPFLANDPNQKAKRSRARSFPIWSRIIRRSAMRDCERHAQAALPRGNQEELRGVCRSRSGKSSPSQPHTFRCAERRAGGVARKCSSRSD